MFQEIFLVGMNKKSYLHIQKIYYSFLTCISNIPDLFPIKKQSPKTSSAQQSWRAEIETYPNCLVKMFLFKLGIKIHQFFYVQTILGS